MSKLDPQEYFGKDYKEFDDEDPFNPNNRIQGFISNRSSDVYGALLIETVNFEKVPQLIYCTPKIQYPFDKNGSWRFPKAKRIERYEKYDGTNIFSYAYKNIKGKEFVSHKTRLLPFVGNSRFGPFQDMLKDLFSKNEILKKLPILLGHNISYELWGAKNPHLVKYEIPLELSILFARSGQKILPPSALSVDNNIALATLRGIVNKDYIWNYQESQKDMESTLKDEGDGYYSGDEGEVWYLLTENGLWTPYKCKPETIEAIHWSAGGIGKNQVIATCENALENWDNPTVENVAELLLEEFPQEKIDKVYYRIGGYLDDVIKRHIFIEQVMKDYEDLGMNILEDKATVMRALSGKYKKPEMKKIFSIIWNNVVR